MAATKERSGGFAVYTHGEDLIEAAAEERYGRESRDPEDRAEKVKLGLVNAKGEVTKMGWDRINEDVTRLERNAVAWLKKTFGSARDEGHGGHGGEELIGTFWFDPSKLDHAENVYEGVNDRIDMSDSSYGGLYRDVWKGVSDFGQSVLGGQVNVFGVDQDALDEVDATLEADRKRRGRRAPKKTTAKKASTRKTAKKTTRTIRRAR